MFFVCACKLYKTILCLQTATDTGYFNLLPLVACLLLTCTLVSSSCFNRYPVIHIIIAIFFNNIVILCTFRQIADCVILMNEYLLTLLQYIMRQLNQLVVFKTTSTTSTYVDSHNQSNHYKPSLLICYFCCYNSQVCRV